MIICVTGSVGTGKTTLAKKLAKKLGYKLIEISKLVKEKKLSEEYDEIDKTDVVDVKKLNKELINLINKNKNLIIEGHLSHYLPKKYVDKCIVTTCNINVLRDRLKKRKYSSKKIKDNLAVEIFDTILIEARKHKFIQVDTTMNYKIEDVVKEI